MQPPLALLTADQLFWMPDDGCCHELVGGRLATVSPPRFVHGICWGRLMAALERHVREQGLGYVREHPAAVTAAPDRPAAASPPHRDLAKTT